MSELIGVINSAIRRVIWRCAVKGKRIQTGLSFKGVFNIPMIKKNLSISYVDSEECFIHIKIVLTRGSDVCLLNVFKNFVLV